MKIPSILFGSYNEVIKRLRPLKNHNIVFMKNFIKKIQAPDKMMEVTEDTPIVMVDGYPTRAVPNAFFPSVLSDYILYDEVYTSDVVSWYMKKAVENSWLMLTALVADSSVSLLYRHFHNKFQIRLLNGLEKHWDELVSVGYCYYNDTLGFCNNKKRLFFEKSYPLLQISSMVMHVRDVEHIIENWKKFKRNKPVIPFTESSPLEEEQKKIMIRIINSGLLKKMSKEQLDAFKKLYMDYFKTSLPDDLLT
ncbi:MULTISPECIES: hypothetical protein [unclassified Treponema]|uniref:hypothetical protein n=1 Tax=unclassified Treponema TaxID=2638727 RepID=UPI0020A33010|nr:MULTISPECIES: hypothetical protein [unclassified Treponema]UTC66239.1 hypothetical protein E4O06_09550 [Treponema sp. OMZ 789]UTC68968.1 hypothetical protein E4O01_09680 [Treponema sp. OMZ 790]UTC71695.1 hypothetical protein E4O02_09870 [Treponema sp. OMZ 791]